MKKSAASLTLLSTILLLFLLQLSISSCKKEVEVQAPPIDTLAVLTAKQYHMEEIRILQDDVFYYYKRGNAGNTASFDQEYIKFNADKTGSYFYNGTTNSLTWDFVGGAKTKITYTLNRTTPIVINWENISYSGAYLSYAEHYTNGQIKSMSTGLRVAR